MLFNLPFRYIEVLWYSSSHKSRIVKKVCAFKIFKTKHPQFCRKNYRNFFENFKCTQLLDYSDFVTQECIGVLLFGQVKCFDRTFCVEETPLKIFDL